MQWPSLTVPHLRRLLCSPRTTPRQQAARLASCASSPYHWASLSRRQQWIGHKELVAVQLAADASGSGMRGRSTSNTPPQDTRTCLMRLPAILPDDLLLGGGVESG